MEISTSRLLLRDVAAEDEAALLALEADPALYRYRDSSPPSKEGIGAWFQRTLDLLALDPRPAYILAIVLPADGRLIGVVTLTITNRELGQAELGYRLAPDFWGQGYAAEAARGLIGLGFSTLGLHRIYALCHPDNSGSRRVMEKIGMQYEGHLREDWRYRNGVWRDSLLYAILDYDVP
ncbi:MAG TPA: GNAT family N-acetyltransferase [Ktedonobacterales bacterium]|nr:GNAT family N-acetyltransferase [Ktedonobacterales bacterium]